MKRLISSLTLLFFFCLPSHAQTYVRSNAKTCGAGTSCATTAINAPTGSTVTLFYNTNADVTCPQSNTVADGSGGTNTFTLVDCEGNSDFGLTQMWVAPMVSGSASETITITFHGGSTRTASTIVFVSTGAAASPIDVSNKGNATSNVSQSFTTGQANEEIIACAAGDFWQTIAAGNIGGVSATVRQTGTVANAGDIACEDLTVSSIQTTQTAAVTIGGGGGTSAHGAISVVSLKAPGGAPAIVKRRSAGII